jgi:hypothetical protein
VTGNSVSALANAVRAGDVTRVSAMLKLRPELVNMALAENDERTALHFAVLGRSAEIVRLLMQGGANARKGVYPHRAATTALTIATERRYGEIVAVIREEERSGPNGPGRPRLPRHRGQRRQSTRQRPRCDAATSSGSAPVTRKACW